MHVLFLFKSIYQIFRYYPLTLFDVLHSISLNWLKSFDAFNDKHNS